MVLRIGQQKPSSIHPSIHLPLFRETYGAIAAADLIAQTGAPSMNYVLQWLPALETHSNPNSNVWF